MDDFDLLDEAIITDQAEKFTDENKLLKDELVKAQEMNRKLQRENRVLKANISSLYKTAINEIERKSKQLAETQSRLDDLILRRCKRAV